MKTTRLCVVLLAAWLLNACATVTLVPAGTATVNGISFSSSGNWNQLPPAVMNLGEFAVTCTADGPALERLIFVAGVPAGKPMFKAANKSVPMPAFDAALLPHEIPDYVRTSLTNLSPGEIRFETTDVKPAALGGAQGVRFGMSFAMPSGLLMKGDALAAVNGGKLYAIIYMAAAEHYYEKYARDIDGIFGSARIP